MKPDKTETFNCVSNCLYFYYYTIFDQYKCTKEYDCPDDYNLLISEKERCIDNCEKDNIYKYQYSGECTDKCPDYTENEVGKYICKDIDINKCLISENKLRVFDENYTKVEKIAKTLCKGILLYQKPYFYIKK